MDENLGARISRLTGEGRERVYRIRPGQALPRTSDAAGYCFNVGCPDATAKADWWESIAALRKTVEELPHRPLLIGEGAITDVGESGAKRAETILRVLGCDAAVINPWGGADTIEPWLRDPKRGAFVDLLPPGSHAPTRTDGTLMERVAETLLERAQRHNNMGVTGSPRDKGEWETLRRVTNGLPMLVRDAPAELRTCPVTTERPTTLWIVEARPQH